LAPSSWIEARIASVAVVAVASCTSTSGMLAADVFKGSGDAGEFPCRSKTAPATKTPQRQCRK
jgi:hypothetical protein